MMLQRLIQLGARLLPPAKHGQAPGPVKGSDQLAVF
jgi:hypothetical protein